MKSIFSIFIFLIFSLCLKSQSGKTLIKGTVRNQATNEVLQNVAVQTAGGSSGLLTNKDGYFEITVEKTALIKLHFSHLSFIPFVKEIRPSQKDTIFISVQLNEKPNLLNTVNVYAQNKPETLVGKPDYSVFDFDFYEDKLILLTAERSLNKAQIRFADYNGKIISSLPLPKSAGTASSFFHDYEGYTDLICSDTIFRLDIMNQEFLLMSINRSDFNKSIQPVADTAHASYYFSNQWDKFPLFNYYFIHRNDTAGHLLSTVSNSDLLKIYNMEYYYLPSGAQLQARRLAAEYKTDKRIIAALMSGFTQSMFYEPLYAPLFILRDTTCIFNHYTDQIYHFNSQNKIIDSVKIDYHHPKNWREWKKQLYVDEFENKVYAFFSKSGHHYLKQINYQTGKEIKTYKLKYPGAQKIKIKDGYVYYIYRPFESTQEKFLYRERIE
ncbi:MAG: carboxypeptidase-like regulatory domain-containing protein [Bacteroidetes bacterium]|nr:carboxypeptidase-like regulatory domain-containing protein [Bacteroidota bacterium]